MDKLKLIKTLVFVLTFLLIFGSLIAVTALFKKTRSITPMAENISLNQPNGSSISSLEEKNGSLYILIKDGGINDRIIIFDLNQGKISSTINLGD